jgi:hypothetical protein
MEGVATEAAASEAAITVELAGSPEEAAIPVAVFPAALALVSAEVAASAGAGVPLEECGVVRR